MNQVGNASASRLAVAIACLLGACSASEPDVSSHLEPAAQQRGSTVTRSGTGSDAGAAGPLPGGSSSGRVGPASVQPKIVAYTAEGDLCPEGTRVDLLNEGASLIAKLSSSVGSELGGGSGSFTGTCRLALDLVIPAGYTFRDPLLCAKGNLQPVNDFAKADITSRFVIAGGSSGATASSVRTSASTGADGSEFLACQTVRGLSAPNCNGLQTQRVRLEGEVTTKLLNTGVVSFQELSLDLSYDRGAKIAACAGRPMPSPSAAGGACGGYNAQQCAAGSVCSFDYRDLNGVYSGVCVTPSLQPVALGEPCGGTVGDECERGATCVPSRAASGTADLRLTGTCRRTDAKVGQQCGTDNVLCGLGLRCSEARLCVNTPGADGDPCGPNLPLCGAGLECPALLGAQCIPLRAPSGAACDLAARQFCQEGLSCSLEGICGPQNDGEVGWTCFGDDDCNEGLRCSSKRCAPAT